MSRQAAYRRMFARAGRRVTIERVVANQPSLKVENVRARVRGLTQEEIAGGINSASRKVLILAEDVPASFLPLRAQVDRVLVDGLTLRFDRRPDDQTHRDGETLLAIDGVLVGA